MVNIPLFVGFHTSQVVQDFSHQQYQYWAQQKSVFLLLEENHIINVATPWLQRDRGENQSWVKTEVANLGWSHPKWCKWVFLLRKKGVFPTFLTSKMSKSSLHLINALWVDVFFFVVSVVWLKMPCFCCAVNHYLGSADTYTLAA